MIRSEVRDHVAEVIIDNPPVNALPVAGWFELADTIRRLGRDPEVRALILAANQELKGYQAGVDIKELAADPTHRTLVEVNRGCWETFAAVYDCEVPVIAAVHGFCLGGGVGIAGNADIVVASDDATFGLPEVDRGALGAATHLSRLVPQHKMRALFFTGQMITAQELLAFGTVERVVPRAQLMDAAREIGAGDRGQEPDRDPSGEGVAERDRPGRRQALVPVRAGLHVRAQPLGRLRRAAPGVRGEARRRGRQGRGRRSNDEASPTGRGRLVPRRERRLRASARWSLPDVRRVVLPEAVVVLPQPDVQRQRPLDDVELSTRGTLWSFTDNRYAPPPPYPAREPFEPYGVAAVELPAEQMVVLGQIASGTDIATLTVGTEMELVVEPLYEDADAVRTVWKWKVVS